MAKTKKERTVTVIGAGLMGGPIAAMFANAGYTAYLLDRVPKDEKDPLYTKFKETGDRSFIAREKLETMRKAPRSDIFNGAFYHPSNAGRVIVGNVDDHLKEAVKNSFFVTEAIRDSLDDKKDLAARVDEHMEEGTQFHSNTSTIQLEKIKEGRSDKFKRGAFIGHWFNPPPHTLLLELTPSADNTPEAIKLAADTYSKVLGKHVEICKDTPLFLGNRIGIPAVMIAAQHAMEQGITAAESDALLGKPFSMGDGFFSMVDLVGLKLIPDLASNAEKFLPPGDEFHKLNHRKIVGVVEGLIAQGYKGRADGGGFFRPKRDEAGKTIKNDKGTILQSIDLNTGEYIDPPAEKSKAVQAGKQGPRAVLDTGGKHSDYAWSVVRDIILYALNRVPEIADHIEGIDAAMRTGYNWQQGPFELLDKIGVGYFTDRVKKDGIALPPLLEMAQGRSFYTCNKAGEKLRLDFDFENKKSDYVPVRKEEGVLRLDDVKRKGKPVIAHKSASTWDLGDGVLGVEFHSKMNAIDPSILYVLNESLKALNAEGSPYEGMVIFNEGKDFSVGANIGLIDGLVQNVAKKEKQFDTIVKLTEKISPAVAGKLREKFNKIAGKMWDATFKFVDNFAYAGQPVFKAMRESPKPVVAAPHGKAWGGGCEVFLHCASVIAAPEFYPALVEAGVGLIPGWGGNLRLLERMLARPEHTDLGPFVPLKKVFEMIADPSKSGGTSAQDAFYKGWLRYGIDEIVANPERQLAGAKGKVLQLRAQGYTPPEPVKLRLPGAQAKTAFKSAVDSFYIAGPPTTFYDVVVTDALGDTLSGGDNAHIGKIITDEEFLKRERENFASLTRLKPTLDRIHHMIAKGKPLREAPLDASVTIDKIREMRKMVSLPDRPMTGKPLDGEEGDRLKRLADFSAAMIDMNGGKYMGSFKNLMRATFG